MTFSCLSAATSPSMVPRIAVHHVLQQAFFGAPSAQAFGQAFGHH